MKLTDRIKNMNFSFLSSVIAIVIGLLFGLVILLISNPAQAMGGFSTILTGAFRDMRSIGRVMYLATPDSLISGPQASLSLAHLVQ